MDFGYGNWKNERNIIIKKRIKFLLTVTPSIISILLIVFFFGYDTPMFNEVKIANFVGGAIATVLFFTILSFIIYRVPKFIPVCSKCGFKLVSFEECEILNIKYIGTKDKTEYKKKRSRIKGRTTYPRGGFSMRVPEYEYTSESTYEIEEDVPIVTKRYLYDITYGCKNCHEKIITIRKESDVPLSEKED